jgi:peptidoglycan/LPS O-acetylase OafA/YrhL
MQSAASQRETFASLTGLRFVLALWITLYHLIYMYGPTALADHPLIRLGNARVDIFFVLSGFVLAHVYAAREGARLNIFEFAKARFARIYPLHALGLAMTGVLVIAAYLFGEGGRAQDFTLQGLVANLFMLQAWNIEGAGFWNFPAWTLSAETGAYVVFPALVAGALAMRRRPLTLLAVALLGVALLERVWVAAGGTPLSEATQVFGVVRGVCGVAIGVAARFALDHLAKGAAANTGLALAGAAVAGASAVFNGPLWVILLGATGLIAGLAGLDRGRGTPFGAPVMQPLGEMSYGVFVLHAPLFMLMTEALEHVGWDGTLTPAIGAALIAASLVVGWLAHRLVEEPLRERIRAWRWPSRRKVATP